MPHDRDTLEITWKFFEASTGSVRYEPVAGPDSPCHIDPLGFPIGPCGTASFGMYSLPVIGTDYMSSDYGVSEYPVTYEAHYKTRPGPKTYSAAASIEPK
jgi:hypothetical protein